MTLKEQAWEVCKWLDAEIGLRIEAEEKGAPMAQLDYGAIREKIEQAIIVAVKEEREAILKIAIDIYDDYRASAWPAVAATAVMKVINAIRARSAASANSPTEVKDR